MVRVYRNENGQLDFIDGIIAGQATTDDLKLSDIDLLETVFVNGKIVRNQTLAEIRSMIHADNGGF